VLEAGERLPDAEVWTGPRERARLSELADAGALLLVFYLFDWSAT
jgi:hypothetical protein